MMMNSTQFTLDDIRRHPQFPFVAWKEDDISFLMLELYWAELVRAALGDEMANYTALWDTERDGNPILTITNQTALRGLRLVMLENEENLPLYPDKTGPGTFYALYLFMNNGCLPDGETTVTELIMCVSVDERYSSYFEYLVRLNCCDYLSLEQMEEAIATYRDKFSMHNPAADLPED